MNRVIDFYTPSVYGVGYVGEGKYSNKTHPEISKKWRGMLQRCYSEKYHREKPTYISCSVHPDWHNFQNFAEWYEENYRSGFSLDKDILVKGNKIYAEKTCCFVPQEINQMLTKANNLRGDLPIGVTKNGKGFLAQISIKGVTKPLGTYATPEEAFQAYKEAKEYYIKKVAYEYCPRLSLKIFKALINYKVEIDD